MPYRILWSGGSATTPIHAWADAGSGWSRQCRSMMLSVYNLYMPEPPVDEFYMLGWLPALWLG